MISRNVFWKCALVLVLLTPLLLLEGWNIIPPFWLSHWMGGVPMTAVASVALFFALAILTAIYSVPPATRED